MSKKVKVFIIGFIVMCLIGVAGVLAVIQYMKPCTDVKELKDYYNVTSDEEAVIVLQNRICDERAIYDNGEVYLNLQFIKDNLNDRFYYDQNEKKLIYALPDEMVVTEAGSTEYIRGEDSKDFSKVITKETDKGLFVAISYAKQFSQFNYLVYDEPDRVVIKNDFSEDELIATVKKATQLRVDATNKSEILKELSVDDRLLCLMENNTKLSKGYISVMSEDGVIGYVQEKCLNKSQYVALESDYEEPEYTSIRKDYDINLTWNVVTNSAANAMMPQLLDNTSGVNTISPTWFSLADEKGNINSLASEEYVKEAHNRNVEVWALIDDFTTDADLSKILTKTSIRQKLINNLISEVKKYDIDGINVDFEKIKSDFAEDYIEFIRELSIECRKNSIVLSVDSYVPMPYSEYYRRDEQGVVADYVIIMAYDEHYAGSEESGSVSSISWVQSAIDNTLEQVEDRRKVIIGIPFYTRLWEEEYVEGGYTNIVSSKALSMSGAIETLNENGASFSWDETTKQNYAEYNKNKHLFRMWVEDEKSLEAKMEVISEAGVGGIGSWRLGFETSTVWDVIGKYLK